MHGPDVGMDEIARTAGVAVGTLYRHFPTKTDLVAAVVSEFLAQVADATVAALHRVEEGSPAFAQLSGLLRDIVLATATNQAAKAAASALNADVNESQDLQRAGVALQAIITAAIDEGAVRSDLSISDFYLLVNNVPSGQPPEVLDRWVDLALSGITGPTSAGA